MGLGINVRKGGGKVKFFYIRHNKKAIKPLYYSGFDDFIQLPNFLRTYELTELRTWGVIVPFMELQDNQNYKPALPARQVRQI